MKSPDKKVVTPFDWRVYTGIDSARSPTPGRREATQLASKRLTRRERWDRILAQRWGNPYCKPGPV